MDNSRYRIGELAEKAGVTRRTIHYYMGRGLLPPSEGEGLGTTYSDEHLYRIILIKKLQDSFLPLEEIKRMLSGMDLEEVRQEIDKKQVSFKAEENRAMYRPDLVPGSPYRRLAAGMGVEIHFPSDNEKAAWLAEKLYIHAENLLKEG
jgi:DNA-binding transcriptional MerR regulator